MKCSSNIYISIYTSIQPIVDIIQLSKYFGSLSGIFDLCMIIHFVIIILKGGNRNP